MSMTSFETWALGLAGVVAFAIGAIILVAPQPFYAGYGIALGSDPALLSELRAPASNLLALGALMLFGLVNARWAPAALVLALTVFIAFPIGRFVGLALDGVPPNAVLAALGIEVAIGALCLFAIARGTAKRSVSRVGPVGSLA